MTAGIVGLGLIGGSLAKAYHEAGERVLAHDIDRDVCRSPSSAARWTRR